MAAIAFGNRSGSGIGGAGSTSIAVTVTINLGDTVIVAVATEATAITAPTDDGGNVYAPVTGMVSNTDAIQLWMCVNAKAATTVTAHYTASRATCCVACYTGGSLADEGATNTGSVANPTVSTTADSAESWIISGFAAHGTGTFTAGTGFLRVSLAGASTGPGSAIVDFTGAGGASVTTSVTHTAVTWAAASMNLMMANPELL